MNDAVRRFARRCSTNPHFFGLALLRFMERKGWSEAELSVWLGCTPNQLMNLRMCPAVPAWPDGEFLIQTLAALYRVPRERLREVCGWR